MKKITGIFKMKLKNAMLIGEKFPGGRVEFIMQQAMKMIEIYPDLQIIVLHESDEYKANSEVEKSGMLKNIHYLNISSGKKRILSLPRILNHPIIFLKSLNKKYYPMNTTLKHYLVYDAIKKLPFKINTLHCHFGQIGIIGSFLKDNELCNNLIVSFYGGDVTGYVDTFGENIYRGTFESSDYLISCTKFIYNKMTNLGANPKKIVNIYLPQDPEFFKPISKKLDNKKIRIITVARLVPEKGIQNAIKAVKILVKKYPNIEYVVVGDGEYKKELMNLTKAYSLENVVKFIGVKAGLEKLREYQNSDIFVLPSITTHKGWVEGGGLTNLEAQLCELPVVASNCGGIPEYVLDGVTGFLAEENPEDLAKKISLLLDNPKLRHKMGKVGREMVKNNFSIKSLDKLEELYK